MPDDPDNANRKQGGGRFKPGQSGNPAGMATGSRHKATKLLDAIGEGGAKDVLDATLQAARSGDMTAAKIILDRVWPARKGRAVVLDLPTVTDARAALDATARLVAAVAAGEMSGDEAAPIAGLIEAARKAIETDDLARRIAALEAHHEGTEP